MSPSLHLDPIQPDTPRTQNTSNFLAHFHSTGPEIYTQTHGHLSAFVSGAGTGGTIAGVGRYLKSRDPGVVVAMCDPDGSGLYNKVKHGVMFDRREAEGTKRRHQVDTVVEGMYVLCGCGSCLQERC